MAEGSICLQELPSERNLTHAYENPDKQGEIIPPPLEEIKLPQTPTPLGDSAQVEKDTVILKVREDSYKERTMQEVHWACPETSNVKATVPQTPPRAKTFPSRTPPRPPKCSPFRLAYCTPPPHTPPRTVHNPYKMTTPSPHCSPFVRSSPKQQRTPTRTRLAIQQQNRLSAMQKYGSPSDISQSLSPYSQNISSITTTPESLQASLSPSYSQVSEGSYAPPASAFNSAQLAAQLLQVNMQCAPELPPSLQQSTQYSATQAAYSSLILTPEGRQALSQLQMLCPSLAAAATSAGYFQDQSRIGTYNLDSLQVSALQPLLSSLVSTPTTQAPSNSSSTPQQTQQQVANKIFVLVEFKRGRTVQYQSTFFPQKGDYVICDGDNGEDVGQVVQTFIAPANSVPVVNNSLAANRNSNGEEVDPSTGCHIYPRILRLANTKEVSYRLSSQTQAEAKCIEVARNKVQEHGLDMAIVDAEYQFDRKKLTFYYDAGERVDFRELVRDLYKIYRARIWMSKTRFQDDSRDSAEK
jgi:hypothetical protein